MNVRASNENVNYLKSNANPESFDECWRGGEPDEAECQYLQYLRFNSVVQQTDFDKFLGKISNQN
jgi:hypothetical protein